MECDIQRLSSFHYFICVSGFACTCICAPMSFCFPLGSEEHIVSCPGTRVKGDSESPYECWQLNLGSL